MVEREDERFGQFAQPGERLRQRTSFTAGIGWLGRVSGGVHEVEDQHHAVALGDGQNFVLPVGEEGDGGEVGRIVGGKVDGFGRAVAGIDADLPPRMRAR